MPTPTDIIPEFIVIRHPKSEWMQKFPMNGYYPSESPTPWLCCQCQTNIRFARTETAYQLRLYLRTFRLQRKKNRRDRKPREQVVANAAYELLRQARFCCSEICVEYRRIKIKLLMTKLDPDQYQFRFYLNEDNN